MVDSPLGFEEPLMYEYMNLIHPPLKKIITPGFSGKFCHRALINICYEA